MNSPFDILRDCINNLPTFDAPMAIAIDGCCAAGKSTLAKRLGESFDCNVFHMDDFFLRPEQRTPDRLSEVGGNVDYERFRDELLIPALNGKVAEYSRFDCKSGLLRPPIMIKPKKLIIVDGSYSLHPMLSDLYVIKVFLELPYEEQLGRILKRNGSEQAEVFKSKWIPLENRYFSELNIAEKCDFVFSGTDLFK